MIRRGIALLFIVNLLAGLGTCCAQDANELAFERFEVARSALKESSAPIKAISKPIILDITTKVHLEAPTYNDNGLSFYTIELPTKGFKRWVNLWVAHDDGFPSVANLMKFLKGENPAPPLVIKRIMTCSKDLGNGNFVYFDSGSR